MLDAIEARAPKPGGEGMASPEGGEAAQIRNIQEFLRQAGGGMGAAGGPEGGPAMPGNPTPEQPVVQGGQAPKTKKSPKGKSKEKAPKKTTSKGDKGNKDTEPKDTDKSSE